jgi:hypothetical protein
MLRGQLSSAPSLFPTSQFRRVVIGRSSKMALLQENVDSSSRGRVACGSSPRQPNLGRARPSRERTSNSNLGTSVWLWMLERSMSAFMVKAHTVGLWQQYASSTIPLERRLQADVHHMLQLLD